MSKFTKRVAYSLIVGYGENNGLKYVDIYYMIIWSLAGWEIYDVEIDENLVEK